MIRNFKLALDDFLTPKFLLLSTLPLVLSIIFLSAIMIFGGREIYEALSVGASSGDFGFLDEEKFPLIAKILSFGATKWVISALFYVAGSFLVLILSVFIALIVAGFLTPVVANEIKRRHYRNLEISEISTARSIKLIETVLLKLL